MCIHKYLFHFILRNSSNLVDWGKRRTQPKGQSRTRSNVGFAFIYMYRERERDKERVMRYGKREKRERGTERESEKNWL